MTMNDLDRARAHLKQAEGARDGTDAALDASIANAYATIALADRLGPVVDYLMRPLRVAVPTHPVVDQDRAWYEARMREAVARRDPEEIRRATDELNRVVEAEQQGDPDPAASSRRARTLDLAAESEHESAHARGTGGVFGQMEEHPNDLDDQEEH